MAWRSTREAPARAWAWPHYNDLIPPDERAAVLAVHEQIDFTGRTVLDLGCGRSVCSDLAAELGAARLICVDRAQGAIEASIALLTERGRTFHTVQADARAVPIPGRCADLVWSHGVVEHFDRDDLDRYLAEACRLSSEYVAFSAPNPLNHIYTAFVARRLAAETWEWGFEEPAVSYAPHLRRLGCEVVFDGTVGRSFDEIAPYADEHDFARYRDGLPPSVPGIATLVIARVAS